MDKEMSDITTKLSWESLNRQQFGRGWVAFGLTDAERAKGRYDPHVMFVHDGAASRDAETEASVEAECRELARLLRKFRIAKQFFNDPCTDRSADGAE
jgi:hypothetical protein